MWQRLVFVLFILSTVAAVGALAVGLMLFIAEGELWLFLLGAVGIAGCRSFYIYGCTHFDFVELDQSFGDFSETLPEPPSDDPDLSRKVAEMRSIEGRLRLLEARREEFNVDIWQIHEQRQQLSRLIQSDRRLQDYRDSHFL